MKILQLCYMLQLYCACLNFCTIAEGCFGWLLELVAFEKRDFNLSESFYLANEGILIN